MMTIAPIDRRVGIGPIAWIVARIGEANAVAGIEPAAVRKQRRGLQACLVARDSCSPIGCESRSSKARSNCSAT